MVVLGLIVAQLTADHEQAGGCPLGGADDGRQAEEAGPRGTRGRVSLSGSHNRPWSTSRTGSDSARATR
jgi:hypothetical protein